MLKKERERFLKLDCINKFINDIWIIGRYVVQLLKSCLSFIYSCCLRAYRFTIVVYIVDTVRRSRLLLKKTSYKRNSVIIKKRPLKGMKLRQPIRIFK
jgi:hypothetical protein